MKENDYSKYVRFDHAAAQLPIATTTPPDFTEHPYYAHVRSCGHCSGPHGHCAEGLKLKNADANLFTEQARQLVEGATIVCWKDHNDRYHVSDEVIERIASFAAEAATQGQIVGIERAAQMCSDYGEEWGHQQHDEVLKAAGLELAGDIRALSPDPDYLDRVRNEAATITVNSLARDVLEVCKTRGWSLHWTHRGAYLHLESSELIEAIRGKHGDPLKEAGDVLLVLMSITENQGIPFDAVLEQARQTASELKSKPRYAGEEYDDGSR